MSRTEPTPTEAPPITDQQIRAAIEVEQIVTMWGQPCTITPRFVEERLGDGLKWIWLSPIMQRPNYWVIRADSQWWMDWEHAMDFDTEYDTIAEHLDEILEAIEAEYGCSEEEMLHGDPEFPYINIEGGSCWGRYDFDRKERR